MCIIYQRKLLPQSHRYSYKTALLPLGVFESLERCSADLVFLWYGVVDLACGEECDGFLIIKRGRNWYYHEMYGENADDDSERFYHTFPDPMFYTKFHSLKELREQFESSRDSYSNSIYLHLVSWAEKQFKLR
jgi:hypothetical protein